MTKLPSPKVVEFQAAPFFVKIGSQNKLTIEQIRGNKFEFALIDGFLEIRQGDLATYLIHGANVKSMTFEGGSIEQKPQGNDKGPKSGRD